MAENNSISLTPEMLKAGVEALWALDLDFESREEAVHRIWSAIAAASLAQEKHVPREIYCLGQNILDSSQLNAGDRLYFYATPECKPLLAVLEKVESSVPFFGWRGSRV